MKSTITKIVSNLDHRSCFYCQGDFSVSCKGEHYAPGNQTFTDTYICTECAETFVVYSLNDELTAFQFTCNNIWIYIFIEQNKLHMNVLDVESAPSVEMPAFVPDFSDKDKLFNKLRTYLIFS